MNIPIVFGGPHCSSYPIETLNECKEVDFLIYGEGEFILPKLLEAISNKTSYYDIPQLCFRDTKGQIIVNKQGQLIENLDMIPFPSRHLFDANLYRNAPFSFITSRGCSYGWCSFCMKTGLLYEKYRRRSVENVIAELEFVAPKLQYKDICFFDDNFAVDFSVLRRITLKRDNNKMVVQRPSRYRYRKDASSDGSRWMFYDRIRN